MLKFLWITILYISFCDASQIDEIMKYIADHHIHGYSDDRLSYEQAKQVIKNRKLHMSCSSISSFTERYLYEMGIESRFILTLTLDKWNNYNNGHSMIEVYDNGEWKLWDIDLKNFFLYEGKQIDAYTFCKISQSNDYEIVTFSNENLLCFGDLTNNGIDYTPWYINNFLSEVDLRSYYQHCCQIPMIRRDGAFIFTSDPKDEKRIVSYPYSALPILFLNEVEFLKGFYLLEKINH